ncbi:MAG: hypothetical protein L6V93_17985 [Clostridiales bacterium]|nr:MAG: hypothetical protein L6V93_17985 [Clostridiales bacterium]
MVIFQLAMVLVTVRDVYTARQGVTRRYFVLYAVMSLIYIFCKFHRRFGIRLHRREQKSCVCVRCTAVYFALRHGVYAHFSLCPYISIMQNYFFLPCFFSKKTASEGNFRGDTAFADFICFFIIRFTPLKFFMDNTDIYDYTSINLIYDETLYIYVPVIIAASLIVASYVILRFNLPEEYLFLRRRKANQKFKILFGDMRHLFHSYKNVMLSIDFLQDKAMKNFGTENAERRSATSRAI